MTFSLQGLGLDYKYFKTIGALLLSSLSPFYFFNALLNLSKKRSANPFYLEWYWHCYMFNGKVEYVTLKVTQSKLCAIII